MLETAEIPTTINRQMTKQMVQQHLASKEQNKIKPTSTSKGSHWALRNFEATVQLLVALVKQESMGREDTKDALPPTCPSYLRKVFADRGRVSERSPKKNYSALALDISNLLIKVCGALLTPVPRRHVDFRHQSKG